MQLYKKMKNEGRLIQPLESFFVTNSYRVLVLAPHGDDEIAGCGGALLYHKQAGHSISCCYLTIDSDPDQATQRRKNISDVSRSISWERFYCCDFPDGKLDASEVTIGQIEKIIVEYAPQIIYSPAFTDPHPDHSNTALILYHILKHAPLHCFIHLYSVWCEERINCCLEITQFWEQKLDLLMLYQGQERYRLPELADCKSRLFALEQPMIRANRCEGFIRISSEKYIRYLELQKEMIEL